MSQVSVNLLVKWRRPQRRDGPTQPVTTRASARRTASRPHSPAKSSPPSSSALLGPWSVLFTTTPGSLSAFSPPPRPSQFHPRFSILHPRQVSAPRPSPSVLSFLPRVSAPRWPNHRLRIFRDFSQHYRRFKFRISTFRISAFHFVSLRRSTSPSAFPHFSVSASSPRPSILTKPTPFDPRSSPKPIDHQLLEYAY
jgi:hypothetical protein